MLGLIKRMELIKRIYWYKELIEKANRGEILLNYQNMVLSLVDVVDE